MLNEELLLNIPGFAFFKDLDGKFLGANKLLMNLIGYNSLDQLQGTTDFEMKCEAVNFANNFVLQDKKALENGSVSMLELHRLADNKEWVYLTKKQPMRDEQGKIIGVACHSTVVDHPLLVHALMTLVDKDRSLYSCLTHGSYYIDNQHEKYNLTEREAECLFYLLRGKSARDIGERLKISPRTVESYIENIKMKFNCKLKSDLIETAIENGLVHYMPKNLIHVDDNSSL